ncbi:unnamed protein product [Gulo gulo]|uniref:Uncharacterized protein n=1 Tax=Gulo gulo TaxID=48420 RepID=A0A9X9LJD7_GULGU|nr:unnamed protein product [Gulo gulo]
MKRTHLTTSFESHGQKGAVNLAELKCTVLKSFSVLALAPHGVS